MSSYTYKIIDALVYSTSINITFLLSFTFIREDLRRVISRLSIAALLIGLFYYCFPNLLGISYLYLFVYMLLIPIFKRVFNLSYSYTIIFVLLALILELIMQTSIKQALEYYRVSDNSYKYNIMINSTAIAIYFLLLIFANWKKLRIIINQQTMCQVLEQNKKDYLNRHVQALIFILSLMVLWISYFLSNLSLFPFRYQNAILFLTITLFIIFILFTKMLAFHKMERIEILVDQQFQKEMLGFMEIIRSQRHDFNFHLQAIAGMLEKENYLECQEYVQAMVKDAQAMNQILPVHHPAVGALLSKFREVASQKGIQLQICIHYNMEKIPCTVYEINKIIGNLIQNAMDEVEQHLEDANWVQILILKRSGNCVIKVSNIVKKDISYFKKIFDFGYSTKPLHDGIGLNTVQKIVSKYAGSFYIEFEEDIVHFIVTIPIKY